MSLVTLWRLRCPALICLALLSSIIISCSQDPGDDTVTGTGSRSPNAPAFMKGAVRFDDNRAIGPSDVEVTLYEIYEQDRGSYVWQEAATVYADTTGAYWFDSVAAGDYSVLVKQAEGEYWVSPEQLYQGFGGYVALAEEDSGLTVDTVVLAPTLSVMGMFQNVTVEAIDVGMIGTAFTTRITDTQTYPFFGFNAVPMGEYRLKIVLDFGAGRTLLYYCPLPTSLTAQNDTTYIETVYGFDCTISITGNNTVELTTPYFILTCLVKQNAGLAKASSRDAADGDDRQLLLNIIKSRQNQLPASLQ